MLLIGRYFSCRNTKRFFYNYMDYSGYIALENHIMCFFRFPFTPMFKKQPHKCGFV